MPRPARRADPARLHAALSPAWRAALDEARELCALGDNWQGAGQLQATVAHVAAMRYATELARAGMGEDEALEQAAAHLGIPADTIRTRQRRWYVATRRPTTFHNEPAATRETVARSERPSIERGPECPTSEG